MLSCTGETRLSSPLTEMDADQSIVIDLTNGLVNFGGTTFPVTEEADQVIRFGNKVKEWESFGSVDRISGKASLIRTNGKMVVVTNLKCTKQNPLF